MSDKPPMRCLGGGYDLRGLPENRCPECGRDFDPNRRSTFAARRPSGREPLVAAITLVVVQVLGLAAWSWWPLLREDDWWGGKILGGTMSAAYLGQIITVAYCIRLTRLPRALVKRRGELVVAVLVAMAMFTPCCAAGWWRWLRGDY